MKRKIILHTTAAVALLAMSSCATVFSGSKKRVTIDSNITEAESLTIDGRKYNSVTFPFQVKIKRGFNETLVTSEADGYNPASMTIHKKFNAATIVNVLFLPVCGAGLLGAGIDAATGAMTKPEYTNYELEFEQTEK